jgi:hypothetical protein
LEPSDLKTQPMITGDQVHADIETADIPAASLLLRVSDSRAHSIR